MLAEVVLRTVGHKLHRARREHIYPGVHKVGDDAAPVGLLDERAHQPAGIRDGETVSQRFAAAIERDSRIRAAPAVRVHKRAQLEVTGGVPAYDKEILVAVKVPAVLHAPGGAECAVLHAVLKPYAYSDLTVTDKGAAFKLKNTGDCAGDEVVQLYISLPGGKVIRPARELKGLTRVHLETGEEKAVTIPFDGYTFRYFNVTTNKFEVEGGAYDILIAASSEDIRLSGKFEVKGTGAADPYAAGNPARAKLLDCYRTCDVHAVPDASFAALLGHPIPQKRWDRSQPLGMNNTIRQMAYAKNPICRMVAKRLGSMIAKVIAGGKPDLNLLFIYNIPFRGMGKMMGGMITMDMADDIRFIANGHLFRGIGRLVKHFLNRPKLTKAK